LAAICLLALMASARAVGLLSGFGFSPASRLALGFHASRRYNQECAAASLRGANYHRKFTRFEGRCNLIRVFLVNALQIAIQS